jgi:hypothetical protein
MSKILIRKGIPQRQISDDLKVNLKEPEPILKQKKQPFLSKNKNRLFFIASLFVIIIFSAFVWRFYVSQKTPFADLIPENAVVWGIINHQELYPQIFPFTQFLADNNFYGQRAISKLNEYFNQVGLSFRQDIQPFFKRQAAFVIMPVNHEASFPFAFILKGNNPSSDFNQFLSQIKPELNKDYNFSSYIYRQIKITVLKPLSSVSAGSPKMYAFAQIEDYLILGNSQKCLEGIIDLVINK